MDKVWSWIVNVLNDIPGFIEENASNPFFWVVLLIIIAGICFMTINRLGDK